MDNGTPPVPTNRPTIRSASDEAAATTDTSKGRGIRSASDEHAPKAGAQPVRPAAAATPSTPMPPSSGTLAGAAGALAPQAARGAGQSPRPWPPRLPSTSGDHSASDAGRAAEQGINRATEFGSALTSGYGAAFSEAVSFMNRAVERQNTMVSSMLQARGPQDIMMAGNRYLVDGWMAFFDANARAVQAVSRLADDAKPGSGWSGRPGA